jgi:predicted DsbA family dithiol-disulfide isomerase
MAVVVPVFFDFACPWSYSSRGRAADLQRALDVRFVYAPWELSPETPHEGKPNEHRDISDSLRTFAASGGRDLEPRERAHNTHRALRGVFFARANNAEEAYVDRMFEAYWEEQANVDDDEVLRRVARESGLDEDAFLRAVDDPAWDHLFHAIDAWGEELGVETTVTLVLPGKDGQPKVAWKAVKDLDVVRDKLAGALRGLEQKA